MALGAEHEDDALRESARVEVVRIPGTGKLDSLNVACACAVLLSEYWRTHHAA